jgi:hypothetical protein
VDELDKEQLEEIAFSRARANTFANSDAFAASMVYLGDVIFYCFQPEAVMQDEDEKKLTSKLDQYEAIIWDFQTGEIDETKMREQLIKLRASSE